MTINTGKSFKILAIGAISSLVFGWWLIKDGFVAPLFFCLYSFIAIPFLITLSPKYKILIWLCLIALPPSIYAIGNYKRSQKYHITPQQLKKIQQQKPEFRLEIPSEIDILIRDALEPFTCFFGLAFLLSAPGVSLYLITERKKISS